MVRIRSHASAAALLVALVASGGVVAQEVDMSPSSLVVDFGDVFLGAEGSRQVTVTSRDDRTLGVSFGFTVRDPAPFSLSGETSTFIRPGQTATGTVLFRPRLAGVSTGVLRITVSAVTGADFLVAGVVPLSIDVALRGNGVIAEPRIEVTPDSVDFGDVIVGDRESRTVKISSTGNALLDINGILLEGGAFSITGEPAATRLPPGTSVDVEISFAPLRTGDDEDLLVINSNAFNNQSVRVPLTGTGIPVPEPEIDVRPAAVDFGETTVGESRREQVEIRNTGTGTLVVKAIALSEDSSRDFELVRGARETEILRGGRVIVEVEYTPNAEGDDAGTLLVDSNDADEERVRVALRGVGVVERKPEIRVVPLDVEFGEVFTGNSQAETVEIRNTGDAVLDVTDVAVVDDEADVFSITSIPRSLDIAPGGVARVEVTYAPADVGSNAAALRIRSNDEDEATVRVDLTGEGVPEPAPEIVVNPLALDFGETFLGSSRRLSFTIRNTGTDILEVTRVFFDDGTSADYSLGASPTDVDIAPGARVTIDVTFTPTEERVHPGTIHILSNDASEARVVVSLVGEGVVEPVPAIEVDPEELDFGSVTVGSTIVDPITVTNRGTAPLILTSVSVGADSSAHFALPSPVGEITLAPGQSVLIDVAYSPAEEGFDSATVRIESNDPNTPTVLVPLSGNGTPRPVPNIVVAPTALKIGSAPAPASNLVTFMVGNTGTGVLNVAAISLGAGTSPDFSLPGGAAAFVVPPGEESAFDVKYTPSDSGADTGTVVIESDDPDTPRTIVPLLGATFPPPSVTLAFPSDVDTPVESEGPVDDATLHETIIQADANEDVLLDSVVYTATDETPLDCVKDIMLFADLNENGTMDDGETSTDFTKDESTGKVAFGELDFVIPKNKLIAVQFVANLVLPDSEVAAVAPDAATPRVAASLALLAALVAAIGSLLCRTRLAAGGRGFRLAVAAVLVISASLSFGAGCSSGGGGGGGTAKSLDSKSFTLFIRSLEDIRLVGADSGLPPEVSDFPAGGIPGTTFTLTGP